MTIKNIIFDMGDVLVKIDPPKTVEAFNKLGAKAGVIDSEAFKSLSRQYHSNHISSAQWRTGVKDLMGIPFINDDVFDAAWLASVIEPKEPSDDFIARLKLIRQWAEEGYNIFLLSNNNQIHYLNTEKCYGEWLLPAIPKEKQYYSHQTGNMKPGADAYTQILSEHNLKAHECIFLDDIPEYIEAAKKVGMHALLYTRLEPLSKVMAEIKRLNIHLGMAVWRSAVKLHCLFSNERNKTLNMVTPMVADERRPTMP